MQSLTIQIHSAAYYIKIGLAFRSHGVVYTLNTLITNRLAYIYFDSSSQ